MSNEKLILCPVFGGINSSYRIAGIIRGA